MFSIFRYAWARPASAAAVRIDGPIGPNGTQDQKVPGRRSASLIRGINPWSTVKRAFYIAGESLLFNNPDMAVTRRRGDWVTSGNGTEL